MGVRVEVLGDVRVLVDGREMPLGSSKQRGIVALLASQLHARVDAGWLQHRIWADGTPSVTRKNLHVLVSQIRKALRSAGCVEDVIETVDGGYRLSPAVEIDVQDAHELQSSAYSFAREGNPQLANDALQRALSLFRGDPFGADSLEPWARHEVGSLDALRMRVATSSCELRLDLEDPRRLLPTIDELVASHPRDVTLRRIHAIALYRSGRQADALATCRAGVSLGTSDDVALRQVERRILAHDESLGVPKFVDRLAAPPIPQHRLLGRGAETASVIAALDQMGVVTITGVGGSGKTRLAMEVARSANSGFDAVTWVDLAPLREPGSVVTALMSALSVTGGDGDAIEALIQAIGTRRLLLVFDNFEHLLDDAYVVQRLRSGCGRAGFLVTSRAELQIDGEQEVRLAPLTAEDAVRLFRERGAAVGGIVENDEDQGAIAQICEAIDRLPLAIELAAARTSLLRPSDLLDRLGRRFDLIRHRDADRSDKHRSLYGVVAWSYDLLDEESRFVLRAMSMFASGCTFEDLRHVTRMEAELLDEHISQLVRNNLAVVAIDDLGERRWSLLETIAEFGRHEASKTLESVERSQLVLDCMLSHADASNGYEESVAGRRIVIERPNWLAAFSWAVEHRPDSAAVMFVSLDRYFHTRGSWLEAQEVADRVATITAKLDTALRGRVCGLSGRIAKFRGDDSSSRSLLHEARSLARAANDTATEIKAMVWEAERLRFASQADAAIELVQEARVLAQAHGWRWLDALATAQHGFALTDLERPDEGRGLYHDAMQTFQDVGDEYWAYNMEANLIVIDMLSTDDLTVLSRLAALAARLTDIGYWTYSAHVASFELRAALEFGMYERSATRADALLDDIRASGEAMLLCYALACASIAFHHVGRSAHAISAAWESLRISVDAGSVLVADYALAVLACSLADVDRATALSCVDSIDLPRLHDGIYKMDKQLIAELVQRGVHDGRPVPSDQDQITRVSRLVEERAPGSATA